MTVLPAPSNPFARRRPPAGTSSGAVSRPPWWREALIVAWLAWIYDLLTGYAPLRAHAAISNAWGIWHAETAVHLDPELGLNRWLARHHELSQIASYYYDNAHFLVTFGLLGLLWWRLPADYRPLRSSLALVNVIAFVVFWLYPLAPPRMLTSVGFFDVVGHSNTFGQWHTGTLATSADQFAAMPSLHVSWALWCTLAVWRLTANRLLRALGVVYPLLTALVIFSTGNHFLFDALGGIGAMVLALLLVWCAEAVLAGRRAGARAELAPRAVVGGQMPPAQGAASPRGDAVPLSWLNGTEGNRLPR